MHARLASGGGGGGDGDGTTPCRNRPAHASGEGTNELSVYLERVGVVVAVTMPEKGEGGRKGRSGSKPIGEWNGADGLRGRGNLGHDRRKG